MNKPVKLVTKAVERVATPQINMIKESHLAAFVFLRMILEGTSNII
jgi:hypothetical protein